MTDDATTLTPKQRAAIRALLAGSTYQEAAEAAGVRPNTVTTWMRDPAFVAELREAERETVEAITRRLMSLGDRAYELLSSIMEDPTATPATQLRAVELYYSKVLAYRELVSLEQRVAELEAEHDA